MTQKFDQLLALLADQHRYEIDVLQAEMQQLRKGSQSNGEIWKFGRERIDSDMSMSPIMSRASQEGRSSGISFEIAGRLTDDPIRTSSRTRTGSADNSCALGVPEDLAICTTTSESNGGNSIRKVESFSSAEDSDLGSEKQEARDSANPTRLSRLSIHPPSVEPPQLPNAISSPRETIIANRRSEPAVRLDLYRDDEIKRLPSGLKTPLEEARRTKGMLQPSYEDSVPAYLHDVLKEAASGRLLVREGLASFERAYDLAVGAIIILNALFIGWQVHYKSRNDGVLVIDYIGAALFCALFTGDLILRLWKQRCSFFHGRDRNWNIFDLLIVILMLSEEILRWIKDGNTVLNKVSILRTFRLLRFVRILQAVQSLSAFREFRLLVDTMLCGTRALSWVILIAISIAYVFGIALTEGSFEKCKGDLAHDEDNAKLCEYFGRLTDSFLSIYKAIFGGILWGELLDSLWQVHRLYPALFVLMISFVIIILTNTVTALVIRMVSEVALGPESKIREQEEAINKLTQIFNRLDPNRSGDISLEELSNAFDSPELVGMFATLNLDVNDDAQRFFQMLDRDGTGVIPQKEFVLGCLRLKGEAKAADVIRLQHTILEVRESVRHIKQIVGVRGQQDFFPVPQDLVRERSAASSTASPTIQRSTSSHPSLLKRANTSKKEVSQNLQLVEPLLIAGGGVRIPKTEERAMSLKQMRRLGTEIQRRCVKEKWVDMRTGAVLEPEVVNLYHLTYNHIAPLTTPDGVVLRGLKKRHYKKGDRIVQYDQKGGEGLPIAEGVVVRDTIRNSSEVQVTMHRGIFLKPHATGEQQLPVLAGDIDCGMPSYVESPNALSYKELVSQGPLAPKWFCCHWWGECVADFIACCESHTKLRDGDQDEASFWVCAYANCQHDLGADITIDPEHSSFRRAMILAKGVLLVLDEDATPFRRIWCDFELYKTIAVDKKPLDIITVHEDQPRLLSEECLPNESAHYKSLREQRFPIRLLVEGMRRLLEEGNASVELDKKRILGSMERDLPMTGSSRDESATDGRLQLALKRANNALHAYFALSAWSFAVNAGLVEDFDPDHPGSLNLAEILSQDEERQRLTLSLAHSHNIVDNDLQVLSHGLPPHLVELTLSFDGCPHIRDAGLEVLADGLPRGLRGFKLDMSNCKEISDVGIEKLMHGLPETVEYLELFFANCSDISLEGARLIIESLPKSTVRLAVSLTGTKVNKSFESAAALRKFVAKHAAQSTWKAAAAMMGSFFPGSGGSAS